MEQISLFTNMAWIREIGYLEWEANSNKEHPSEEGNKITKYCHTSDKIIDSKDKPLDKTFEHKTIQKLGTR